MDDIASSTATMKFGVGVMLTSFGLFWGAEGAGAHWPGNDAAGHDEFEPWPQGEFGGDVEGVGDHGEVDPFGEQPGQHEGGGAA